MIKIYLENGIVYEADVTIDRVYDRITELIDDGIPFLCIESSGVKRLIKIDMIEEIAEIKAGLSDVELAYIRACSELIAEKRALTTNVNITFDESKGFSVEELADKISKVLEQKLIKSSH